MTKIGIWGGTGSAGSNIAREAVKRGSGVTVVTEDAPVEPIEGVDYVEGSIGDVALVDKIAAANDVVVVAIAPARQVPIVLPSLVATAREHRTRLGFVEPESLALADVIDRLPADSSHLDWFVVAPAAQFEATDFALAVVDEIAEPKHRCQRFTVGR